MADNVSLARPYAKAVFSLAEESGTHEAWQAALQWLAAISADDDFAGLINNPKVDVGQVSGLLIDLVGDVLPEGGVNFINLLVSNDRVTALRDIDAHFSDLLAQAKAQVNASVVSALPLNDDQRQSIASALEQRLGLKVQLEESVDASLMGGAVIKAGDLVIDGSARGRIEKLSLALLR